MSSVCRATPDNPTDDGTNLHREEAGQSNIHWDTQAPQEKDGFTVWSRDDGYEVSEARLIIVPENCGDVYDDADWDEEDRLPVREKLVDAYVEYFASHELDEKAKKGNFIKAMRVIGFKLTKAEEKALSLRLAANAA